MIDDFLRRLQRHLSELWILPSHIQRNDSKTTSRFVATVARRWFLMPLTPSFRHGPAGTTADSPRFQPGEWSPQHKIRVPKGRRQFGRTPSSLQDLMDSLVTPYPRLKPGAIRLCPFGTFWMNVHQCHTVARLWKPDEKIQILANSATKTLHSVALAGAASTENRRSCFQG